MLKQISQIAMWFAAASLTVGFVAGCESPAMQRARRTREASMSRTLQTIGSLDDRRGDNLARTARIIDERFRRDQETAARNISVLGNLIEEEFETWAEKEPAYRRAIGQELSGNDASIERTVPHFIY